MKPFTLVFLSLAPFLSLADTVDGAPAGAINNNNNLMAKHRRAPAVESPDSPWRRRHMDSKRQADNGTDTNTNDGPPLSISVNLPDTSSLGSSDSTPPPTSSDPGTTATTSDQNTQTSSDADTATTTATSSDTDTPTTTSSTPDTPTTTSSTPDTPTTTSSTPDTPTTTSSTPDTPTTTSSEADTPTGASSDAETLTTTSSVTPTSSSDAGPSSDADASPTATPTTTSTPINIPATTTPDQATPDSATTSAAPTSTANTDPPANDLPANSTTSIPPPDDPTTSTSTSTDPAQPTDPLGVSSALGNIFNNVTSDIGIVTSDLGTAPTDPAGNGTTTTTTDVVPTSSDNGGLLPSLPSPSSDTTTATASVATDSGGITGLVPVTSSSSSTSQILDIPDVFPGTTATGDTPTTTIIASTSQPPLSIDSQYQFITASSFLLAPTTSTSGVSVTNTDPDAALSTVSLPTGDTPVTLTAAAVPSSIPMFIRPPQDSDTVDPGTNLPGYTEISILFQLTVNWLWVLSSPETAGQILGYVPALIEMALNAPADSLKTVGLQAFQPANYASPSDLMTMYVGLLKTELVDDLSAIIRDPSSAFYHSNDPVAASIAKNVVMSFNIATLNGVSNSDGASTSSSSTTTIDNSRRNAIIGVSVAFGLIALAVFVWWILKAYKVRREGSHQRLSYGGTANYGTAGAGVPASRADSPPAIHNPFMTEREREEEARGIRRNSFYAIGPDDASLEEETFDYMSQRNSGGQLRREISSGSGGRGWGAPTTAADQDRLSPNYGLGNHPYARKPVIGQPISQPILRESSMGNW